MVTLYGSFQDNQCVGEGKKESLANYYSNETDVRMFIQWMQKVGQVLNNEDCDLITKCENSSRDNFKSADVSWRRLAKQ